jgi:hypothetical protein
VAAQVRRLAIAGATTFDSAKALSTEYQARGRLKAGDGFGGRPLVYWFRYSRNTNFFAGAIF